MSTMIKIESQIKEKYKNQYSDESDFWRELGAKGKAENIIDVTKSRSYDNIVDIGAGDGSILSFLSGKKFSKYATAVEISESAIEQIKKRNISNLKEIIEFDGYSVPLKDKAFDLAVCSHVLEHVEHPRILLREIKRISEFQVFEVPIDYSLKVDKKADHFLLYGHINIYNPALFRFLLKTEGFEIINDKCSFYDGAVLKYLYKDKPKEYLLIHLKKLIWNCIPFLMKTKPNTYTILTKDSGKKINIF
jgi:ubiquinone/menaquinone biosynthesis C-methylase UbiE